MKNGIGCVASILCGLVLGTGFTSTAAAQASIEQIAKDVEAEMTPTMPLQVSGILTLRTVVAEGIMVTVTGDFSYTKTGHDAVLAMIKGSDAEVREELRRSAKEAACTPGVQSQKLIAAGGNMRYRYRFMDGTDYTAFDISSCG